MAGFLPVCACFDANNDGLKNRIVWAAAGNAVLFCNPDDNGEITETRQSILTKWNPTTAAEDWARAQVTIVASGAAGAPAA